MTAPRSARPPLGKTPRTVAVLAALLAIPYASRSLSRFRVWDPLNEPARDALRSENASAPPTSRSVPVSGATGGLPARALGEQALLPTQDVTPDEALAPRRSAQAPANSADAGDVVVPLEDPSGHALDSFYRSLLRTSGKEPGSKTRIVHYGDSLLTGDVISGAMRRALQDRFGDAGHGFLFMSNPWSWYFQNDVVRYASEGWTAKRLTGPLAKDGLYGLGGVSFQGKEGASAHFGTAKRGDYGRNVSRFVVYWLEQPGGGDFELAAQGASGAEVGAPLRVHTEGQRAISRITTLEVPDGENRLAVRVLGSRDVRMFGVSLEREMPGVIYDSIGALGGRVEFLNELPEEHWKEQLEIARPSLIILEYGKNEAQAPELVPQPFEKNFGEVLDKLRRAAPDTSVLVVSTMDRGELDSRGEIRTMSVIARLVDSQRSVALAHGSAFWSAFRAMGGPGSCKRWRAKGLLGSDLTHPSVQGGEMLAAMLTDALLSGFQRYAAEGSASPDP